jgi:hypothetical protein
VTETEAERRERDIWVLLLICLSEVRKWGQRREKREYKKGRLK